MLAYFGLNRSVIGATVSEVQCALWAQFMLDAFPESGQDLPVVVGSESSIPLERSRMLLEPRFSFEGDWVAGCELTMKPITDSFSCWVQ